MKEAIFFLCKSKVGKYCPKLKNTKNLENLPYDN